MGFGRVGGMAEILSIRMRGGPVNSISWVRVLLDGSIELEFFDHGPEAESAFGNQVAWVYRIEAIEKPVLRGMLEAQTGQLIPGDEGLLGALAGLFESAWAIRDWLKEKGIAYSETFDSWA